MAHVKVIRRSLLPDEWTKIRMGWLRRLLIEERHEIEGWTIREGRQIGDHDYEMYDALPRPLKRGDEYFTPDGTAFLHVQAVLPPHMRGREDVRLRLATAAEMLVRINGRLQGGIDPNRETMLLPASRDGRYVIDIEGYNRSKPDDDRNMDTTVFKGCRQIFQGAQFVVLNPDAVSLYHDVSIFYDMLAGGQFDEDFSAVISDRLYHALSMVDFDTGVGMKEADDYIQKELYHSSLYRGAGAVAMVGHSHLDIAYYWRRHHAVQKNARTCLIQLELMERYPQFRYTHTQAYLFETLEQYYPELFERVREKVKSGQFEPAGGMYVESDCNLPAAESLVRQFLYGQHYFRSAFGQGCKNCWLPDVFGNSAILPQILKKSGIDYFVSNKMSTWNDTNRFPHNSFIWRGLDGSEVYACVPPTHFITAAMPSEIMQNWAAYQDKDSGAKTLCMFGYGDGGSGVTEEMLKTLERLPEISAVPNVELTGGQDFLSANFNEKKKLAVWDGELYLEMHRGTFTTKSDLKRCNRQLEIFLRDAELACALRWLQGEAYPAEELRKAWKTLLINQFHDFLPGSHIHPVYEDAMRDYEALFKSCVQLMREDGDGWYNTLSFDRSAPAFIPDPDGSECHLGVRGRYIFGSMPALDAVLPREARKDEEWLQMTMEQGSISIFTDTLRAVLLPDGTFASYCDHQQREYVQGAFNQLRLFRDVPGNYDAWDILPSYREIELPLTLTTPLHLLFRDGETAVLGCTLKTQKSTIERRIRFFRDQVFAEVEHLVSWHEDHVLMKAEFECAVRTPYALCDLGAGYITRETNRNTTWQQARYEVCHHKWCDLSETGGGVAIINDGKYGVGLWDNMISLSLLRATCRPDLVSDRAEHAFGYLIMPHQGSAVEAGVNQLALEYNSPLRKTALPGVKLPVLESLLVQSIKCSEDGERWILRLTEQEGRRGVLKLPFPVQVMNLVEDVLEEKEWISYHPFEMLTLGISPRDARTLLA